MAEVWGKHEVGGKSDESGSLQPHNLYGELAKRLEAAELITEHATHDHLRNLNTNWQLPMYNMDFAKTPAQLKELREQREANIRYDW